MKKGEEKEKEKDSIRNKEIWALVLIVLLFILIRFALLYIGAKLSETRENELLQLKMSTMTDIVSDAGAKRTAAARRFSDHQDIHCRLMTSMLSAIGEEYVDDDLLSESEYAAYLDRYSEIIDDVLENADSGLGGITLLVRETDGHFEVHRQYGSIEGFASLTDEQLREAIRQSSSVLTLNDKDYQCTAAPLDDNGLGQGNAYIVQIIPQVSLSEQNVTRALVVVLVMVILFAAVTVYVTSVQRRTAGGNLTEEEKARWSPDSVRRRMITFGLLSVVIVFAAALLVESVGQLYMELRYGRDTLRLFAGQVEKENRERLRGISREEEGWMISYGEDMAALISEYPELAEPEKLQEYCDILGLDWLMLFDSKGNELACSRDYVGFSLGDSPEDGLYDFRQLLHGLPSMVREVSPDVQTGLSGRLIGVKVPASEPGKLHGALIMALKQDSTDGLSPAQFEDRTISLETAHGIHCFAADASSGEILYACDATVRGETVSEYGLPENSLQDGYMGFTAVSGTNVLVITVREGDCIYYYAAESGTMFDRVLLYGLIAALLYALVLALLLVFLLNGDSQKAMDEWNDLRTHDPEETRFLHTDDLDAVTIAHGKKPEEEGKEKTGILEKLLNLLHWDQKNPGQRAAVIGRLGLILLILCCLDVLNGKGISSESYDTMLGFLLHGDWMRGLNLFSLCSCLLIIAIGYLVNIAASLLLKLTGLLFSGQGETICRLLYSCVKYVTVLGVLYFCLEYLGFPTGVILAALASVSLAVSLGAQDLIADILAGLFIVFDGSFHVGNVVEINGKRGTVLELGVRTTRIRIPVNNILVVNNHEIKDILNLSKEYSAFMVSIRVFTKNPLSELEETINRALPAIGEKDNRILYGPYLVGVTALPDEGSLFGPSVTLSVGAMCDEKNKSELTWFLNRELKLLAEREGIEMV